MKDITRIFVETTIRKAIRDIKDSPKRSFRNLIDLGLNFAKGRFEKPFLVSVQNLLQNEQSPYYDLVLDTVHNVDTDRLITFGMNVGYNGCTKGAKIIREIESKENYNIPWSLSLEIDGVNHIYRCYFTLCLKKNSADLRHLLCHISSNFSLRSDGISKIVAATCLDRSLGDRLVALH